MLGRLVRILLALTAIAPLSISLAYVFANQRKFVWALAAVGCCVALGSLALWIITRASERLEQLPIAIQKAKSTDKEVIGFFVAYALPLMFRGPSAPDLEGWLVAGAMLLFVLWSTHAIQVNPVLGVLGFHFYEVEAKGGVTYLLISRRKISNVLSVVCVAQLSEYGLLEAKPINKGQPT
jgi:hypothetical protein